MRNLIRLIFLILFALVLAMMTLLLWLYIKSDEQACAEYTYRDVMLYLDKNLNKRTSRDPSMLNGYLSKTMIFSNQNTGGSG